MLKDDGMPLKKTVIKRKDAHLALLAKPIQLKSHTYDCLQYNQM